MDFEFPPGGRPVPQHAHPGSESFEVLQGAIDLRVGRQVHRLAVGETFTVTTELHSPSNPLDVPAVVRVVCEPGAFAERGLRGYFGMARDGLIRDDGRPRDLLAAAVLNVSEEGELYLPPLPRAVYRRLMRGLATLGRWRGKEELLARYQPAAGSGGEGH